MRPSKKTSPDSKIHAVAQRSLGLLFAMAITFSVGSATASEAVSLSATQQQTILDEAGESYTRAIGIENKDSADAKELFETAAKKYQLLVDSGARNSQLYSNLGNAYLQSGELGRAIANYERAKQYDPSNQQLLTNLRFANSRVKGQSSPRTVAATTSVSSLIQRLRIVNDAIIEFVGMQSVIWTLAIASLVFWGLLIVRTAGRRFPVWRCAALPAMVLIAALGSMALIQTDSKSAINAVVVANNVALHAGDGDQFDEVFSVDAAQGLRVEVLAERGGWIQIRTAEGHTGWVHSSDAERLDA